MSGRSNFIRPDGSIVVQPGDTIGKYCIAIHGRIDVSKFNEYMHIRKVATRANLPGEMPGPKQPLTNVDLIFSGEILYHVPSTSPVGVPLVPPTQPKSGPPKINDLTAGQGTSPVDCGYFAGYAVAEHSKRGGGSVNISFNAKQVYDARNAFERISTIGPGREKYLSNEAAVRYLESLGLSRYRTVPFASGEINRLDDQGFASLLKKATGNGRSGMMISGSNHWIAALNVETFGDFDYVRLYDPGGVLPNVVRNSGNGSAGQQLCWMELFNFQMYLGQFLTDHHGRAGFVQK